MSSTLSIMLNGKLLRAIVYSVVMLQSAVGGFAQERVALIAKYGSDPEIAVRFDFVDGKFVSKETLFSSDTDKNGWIGKIVKQHYLLTYNATVYEHRPNDELTFDLRRGKLVDNSVRSGSEFKVIVGDPISIRSPNGKAWIRREPMTARLDEIVVYQVNGQEVTIPGPFRATVSDRSSISPTLPIVWVDNERFITQRVNGELLLVSITKEVKEFEKIPCGPDDFPRFKITQRGRVIYECGKEYLLNIENLSFREVRDDLDFDFSVDYKQPVTTFYYRESAIGTGGIDTLTTEKYLAVTDSSRRVQGPHDASDINTIRVWNALSGKWNKFVLDEGYVELLGWYRY